MEFSRYVVDALATFDCVSKDYDYSLLSQTRGLSEHAPCETDTRILSVIVDAIAMRYNPKKRSFDPLTPVEPQNFDDVDLDILRSVLQITKSAYPRAKFAHIIWLLTKDNRYGDTADPILASLIKREQQRHTNNADSLTK